MSIGSILIGRKIIRFFEKERGDLFVATKKANDVLAKITPPIDNAQKLR